MDPWMADRMADPDSWEDMVDDWMGEPAGVLCEVDDNLLALGLSCTVFHVRVQAEHLSLSRSRSRSQLRLRHLPPHESSRRRINSGRLGPSMRARTPRPERSGENGFRDAGTRDTE